VRLTVIVPRELGPHPVVGARAMPWRRKIAAGGLRDFCQSFGRPLQHRIAQIEMLTTGLQIASPVTSVLIASIADAYAFPPEEHAGAVVASINTQTFRRVARGSVMVKPLRTLGTVTDRAKLGPDGSEPDLG
jgi:hypothetical protein